MGRDSPRKGDRGWVKDHVSLRLSPRTCTVAYICRMVAGSVASSGNIFTQIGGQLQQIQQVFGAMVTPMVTQMLAHFWAHLILHTFLTCPANTSLSSSTIPLS